MRAKRVRQLLKEAAAVNGQKSVTRQYARHYRRAMQKYKRQAGAVSPDRGPRVPVARDTGFSGLRAEHITRTLIHVRPLRGALNTAKLLKSSVLESDLVHIHAAWRNTFTLCGNTLFEPSKQALVRNLNAAIGDHKF